MRSLVILSFLALGVIFGCTDADDAVPDQASAGQPSAGKGGSAVDSQAGSSSNERGGAPATGEPRLYGVIDTVFTADGSLSYLTLVDSLTSGMVDHDHSIELPGNGGIAITPLIPGKMFLSDGESPRLTRYRVDSEGNLTEEKALSFVAYGLAAVPSLEFVSPTKAYAVSFDDLIALVWNPTTMKIEKEISLADLAIDGQAPHYYLHAAIREGSLYLPAGYYDGVKGFWSPESRVGVINLETDELSVLEEKRCGGLRAMFPSSDGGLFFSGTSSGPAVTQFRVVPDDQGPCIVRMRPGEQEIDQDFIIRVSELTGGQLAGDFFPGPPGYIYYQQAAIEVTDQTPYEDVVSTPFWNWMSVTNDVLDGELSPEILKLDVTEGVAGGYFFTLDEKLFLVTQTQEYTDGVYWDATDPEHPKAGLTVPGSPGGAFRVR